MLSADKGQRTLRVLPPATPLRREVQGFLVDRAARGLSQRTIAWYSEKLKYVTARLEAQGVAALEDLTPDALRRFLLAEADRRTPGGVHALYRALRTFLLWWEAEVEPEGWRNPIEKVRAPRVPLEPLDPLSLEDLRRMLATCERRTFAGDRDRALMLALLDTGCRVSEFLALDLGDLDPRTGALTLRHTKGKRARTAFVGRTTQREILRYLRHRPEALPGDPLWVTRGGGRLTYFGLVSMLRRRASAAGIGASLPHSFRRAFALACLRQGMDVVSLQRLLGHADLSVIMRYVKQTKDDLQKSHSEHGPVDSLLRP